MVKVPKGELTAAEIRTLIKGHNKLVNIKVPTGLDRDGLIKFLKSKKYEVDHKNKMLVYKSHNRGKAVSLQVAKELTKPKPKTALQKQKIAEAKAEKAEKKKKETRAIKKEAIKQQKLISMKKDKEKSLKDTSVKKGKGDMPKPKQPKATQKLKSQKEDEVRPKEKVGRPKVDPKKIKVIQPKKKEEKKVEPKKKKAKKMTIEVLKSIAKQYYTSVSDDFSGDLNKIKNNIDDGWDVFIEEDEPLIGYEEYYEGLNDKQINELHDKIKPKVIEYAKKILKDKQKKKVEPKKKVNESIVLTNAGIQYVARIFANAMDDIMGEKEETKNKQFYFDLQKSQFLGDKLFKFLKSKSKANEKKRNKIIQALEWWAKFVGSDFKKKRDIFSIADVDNDPKLIPLGLPWEKYEMGNVNPEELIAIGRLVETFTPYKMVNKYSGFISDKNKVEQFEAQKFIKK